MIDTLSPFIVLRITDFLDKSDKISLRCASKSLNNYGWRKSIEYDGAFSAIHSNYKTFMNECSRHRITLQKMTIKNIRDPLYWIPFWVRDMEFVNCGAVISQLDAIPSSVSRIRKIRVKERNRDDCKTKFIEVPKLSLLY
jgi:hypothetical protein